LLCAGKAKHAERLGLPLFGSTFLHQGKRRKIADGVRFENFVRQRANKLFPYATLIETLNVDKKY